MKSIVVIAFMLAIVTASPVFAHGNTGLESSTPAKNAMLMSAPETLELKFSQPLRLIKVILTGEQSGQIDTGFTPSMDKQATFSQQLPNLGPDSYSVEWIAMAQDGHKLKGSFSFMVH